MRRSLILVTLAALCCAKSAGAQARPATAPAASKPAATRPATLEIRRGIELGGPREERARRVYEQIIRQVEPSLVGDPARLPQYLALFTREFVEDPRQFAIDIRAERGAEGRIVLSGHLEYAEHRRALLTFLRHLGFTDVDDRIRSLPSAELGEAPLAIVRAERCFLYSRAAAPRETVTEAVAGEPLFLLKDAGDGMFLAHGGADGYVGYVDAAAVERVGTEAFLARLSPPRSAPDERVEHAVAAAQTMLGAPYVWGGRTNDGVDCSGLVQTAYRTAGVNLPRDADQQSLTGRLVATRSFRAGLRRGDVLLFLGRRGTVSHTAIYLGDDQMIEATSPVAKISSFNPAHANYSRSRDESFCFAKRMVD